MNLKKPSGDLSADTVTPSNMITVSRTILGNIFSYNGSVNFYMFFGGRDKFF